MAFEIGKKYDVVVIGAGLTESKEKHTPILWFKLKHETAGTIDRERVVTPKTLEFIAKEMLECFGITREQLASEAFIDEMPKKVTGAEVSITIKGDEQKDGTKKSVVEWMNPRGFRRQAASAPVKATVAAMFGGKSVPATGGGTGSTADWGMSDSDAPF